MPQYLMSVWHDDEYEVDFSSPDAQRLGAQVGAFNEELQQADQNNALIPVLMQVGKHAEHRVEQVDQGLDRFIEFWPRLNTAKEK